MVAIPTVSVRQAGQLVEGAWYVIKGTNAGKPLPPQVFQLVKIHPPRTFLGDVSVEGWVFWHMLGIRKREWTSLSLKDVNIPEHGEHDIHLERVGDAFVQTVMKNEQWKEIAQDLQRRANGRPKR